jgi:hypothetical protein
MNLIKNLYAPPFAYVTGSIRYSSCP